MLEKIYSRSATVSELRSGPLGLFVDDFGSLLASEGYTCEVIETKLAVIRSLHFWLVQRDIPLGHLTSRLIDQFVSPLGSGNIRASHIRATPRRCAPLLRC